MSRINSSWKRWAWLPALPVLWEGVRLAGEISPLLMPPFGRILREFFFGLASGTMALRWILSLGIVGLGLAAGTGAAVVILLLSRSHRSLENLFSLVSSLLHPLPGLALLPLVILWFGIGIPAVMAIIVHAVLWPVFVNLESGLRSLPEAWILYSRNLKLSVSKRFFTMELPGSFPYLISGLRTGWARSWRAFIASEMVFGAVGGRGGLGWQLFESRVMMDTTALYAALLAVMITGLAMEELLFAKWESKVRGKWGLS